VSLLTISLRRKSFVGIGLDLMLVLSVQESLLQLHLIVLPLFSCLLVRLPRHLDPILVSHHLVARWTLILLLMMMRRSGFSDWAFVVWTFGIRSCT